MSQLSRQNGNLAIQTEENLCRTKTFDVLYSAKNHGSTGVRTLSLGCKTTRVTYKPTGNKPENCHDSIKSQFQFLVREDVYGKKSNFRLRDIS